MKKLIVLLLVLCCMSASAEVAPEKVFDESVYTGKLAVWFFSLTGEDHTGESILIRTPNGHTLLVDGGIPEVGIQVNTLLKKLNVTDIDAVIATHMHIDHVGGLSDVLAEHQAGCLYTSPLTDYQTSPVNRLGEAASAQGLSFTPQLAGDTLMLDGIEITFLSPVAEYEEIAQDKITGDMLNDSSLVFMLTYGNQKLLFMGDATRTVEAELIQHYGDQLRADFIKIGHHGSSDTSSLPFVKMVNAADSVMCIYAFNDFNIYDRYRLTGNKSYVTSIDGAVLYVTDGEETAFYTEKERKGMLK